MPGSTLAGGIGIDQITKELHMTLAILYLCWRYPRFMIPFLAFMLKGLAKADR